MKSIGARLAFWYAVASTATLACLFLAGRYFLEQHVIHGLDLLNASEFEQVKAHLGPDYAALTPALIDERLRDTVTYGAVLFYVQVEQRGRGVVFKSNNLGKLVIPDADLRTFNAPMPGIGELRAGEFMLGPFDITIATSKRQVREVMVGYQKVFIGLLAFMFGISAVVGYALSRMALRPVRLMQETAAHIGSDNLSERIPVPPVEDEISNLARLLNEMFDRLEAAFNQTRRFTAEASHELKTPLSLVRLQAEKLLIEGGLKPSQEEAMQVLLEEIARLNQIIEELLFLSRAEARAITLQAEAQNPRRLLESFATDARVLAESRGVIFTEHITSDGEAVFDPKWIRQVLLNLLANALNVTPRGRSVVLTSEFSAGVWCVTIEDEGPGVPAEQRERIFERFVRLIASPDRGGSGLGLAISRSILRLHRGSIRAEAAPGGGLKVIFEIPAQPAAVAVAVPV
jgi:signal transduction histidine kinase